jgi:hypothetical protein
MAENHRSGAHQPQQTSGETGSNRHQASQDHRHSGEQLLLLVPEQYRTGSLIAFRRSPKLSRITSPAATEFEAAPERGMGLPPLAYYEVAGPALAGPGSEQPSLDKRFSGDLFLLEGQPLDGVIRLFRW